MLLKNILRIISGSKLIILKNIEAQQKFRYSLKEVCKKVLSLAFHDVIFFLQILNVLMKSFEILFDEFSLF